ncbi:VTT domain-containing protein [Pseudotabrizicola sp. 4114]|uniref:YqaA family protein n=1 Tax=Pseudotabrizicola sp. 4114 TaxID=2817731 RepID=UPI00285C4390|nr:membrane protein YqaA with SNARE-associated domain [Pseudorhodobacter sp. 4114]
MLTGSSLAGLFVAAFLAATPVPFQSEVVFLALMAQGTVPVVALVLVASVGNILGSCVTYALGRGLGGDRGARWLGLTPARQAKAERWFGRWGIWALLFSWAPGGDLIVALSGALRVPLPRFVVLVTIAKTVRYTVVALIGLGIWS